MIKRWITAIVLFIISCVVWYYIQLPTGLQILLFFIFATLGSCEIIYIISYRETSSMLKYPPKHMVMSFKELKTYMDISSKKYNIKAYTTVVYHVDNRNTIKIYFDSFWSNILYLIYRYKHVDDDIKELYLTGVQKDIDEFKKETENMINEARKSLNRYNNKGE